MPDSRGAERPAVEDYAGSEVIALLESFDFPIMIMTSEGSLSRFNQAAMDMFGLEAADIGRPARSIAVLREVKEFEAVFTQIMANALPCRREIRHGDRRFIMRLTSYAGAHGEKGGMLTFTNVTALLESVEQAVYEREYAKTIINAMSEPLVVLDSELRVQTANRAFYVMCGVSREQSQGVPLRELGDRQWKDFGPWDSLKAIVAGGNKFEPREIDREAEGLGRRTFLLDARALPFNRGGAILLNFQDITRHKQMEEVLRNRGEQFETLLNQAPMGVFLVDSALRIREVNPVALPVFGAIAGGVIGLDLGEVMHVLWEQQYADEIVGIFRHTLETGEPYITAERAERRLDRGIVEFYEWRLDRITLPDGCFGLVCYFRDISAQVQARQALADSEAQLRAADRHKDEFLATLAHELRNPLAPIRNWLQTMRISGTSAPAGVPFLEMMDRQVSHMVRLVDDLLEVSRISHGKIELKKQRIDLATVLRSAVEASKPIIDAAGHQIVVSQPDEPVIVDGDLVRLAQIFANMLNNAAKYTEPGGIITVEARREDTAAVVSIRDTGVGIPPEMLSRVFDMFTQVDNALRRFQDGLGIGLNLVRTLVEMHGGSVEAHSDGPGRGSEFVVRLPLAEGQLRDDLQMTLPHQLQKPPASATPRVLVVDDNKDSADSLGLLLTLLGAEVQIVYDGQSALDKLGVYNPSVLFLDIGMPGLDGYEVARRVRQDLEFSDMLLIALTGWGQDEDRNRTKTAGFNHHIVKPVELDTLQALFASIPRLS
jgi:PAS domain S-box-containing protein